MNSIAAGNVLIADPFLRDPNFLRSAIFLCDHREEGSFGFVMNRKIKQPVGELVELFDGCGFPVYEGGPVQQDTVHFLHQRPDLISGGQEVINGIYWGGDMEDVAELLKLNKISQKMIRFYLGYSGWGKEQLENEVKEKSWLITTGNKHLVFHNNDEMIWKDAIKQLGEPYTQIINYPLDPQMN